MLVLPPAASIVRLTLRVFGTASNICAKVSQVLGYWRPSKTGLADEQNDKRKFSNGQVKTSGPGLESDSTRAQAKKKSGGKKNKAHESKASSDNVHNSSNQGGGGEPVS